MVVTSTERAMLIASKGFWSCWKLVVVVCVINIIAVLGAILFSLLLRDEDPLRPSAVPLTPPSRTLVRRRRSGLIDAPDTNSIIDTTEILPGDFWIYRKKVNWHTARTLCENDGRRLATFENREDAVRVIEAIYKSSHFSVEYVHGHRKEEMGLDREYWIGLFDFGHEGRWEWLSKNFLVYDDLWATHQPDHVNEAGDQVSGRPQHCVGLWNPAFHKDKPGRPQKHSFDDKECTHDLYFICGRAQLPPLITPSPPPINERVKKPRPTTATEATMPKEQPPPPPPLPPQPPRPPPSSCKKNCENHVRVPVLNTLGKPTCKDGYPVCRERTKCDEICLNNNQRVLAIAKRRPLIYNCAFGYRCPSDVIRLLHAIMAKNGWSHDSSE